MRGRDVVLLAAVTYYLCPNVRHNVNDFAAFYLKSKAKEAKAK